MLSSAEITGIALGSIGGLVLIVSLIFVCCWTNSSNKSKAAEIALAFCCVGFSIGVIGGLTGSIGWHAKDKAERETAEALAHQELLNTTYDKKLFDIVSLNYEKEYNVEGSGYFTMFLIGHGSMNIKGEATEIYSFYKVVDVDTYKMDYLPVADSFIRISDTVSPSVHKIKKQGEERDYYYFFVPRNYMEIQSNL